MSGNLLTRSENRRLNLIHLLAQESEPVILAELSRELDASVRVLKDDLAYFRNELNDFDIETSQEGVSLNFKENKGLKTISRRILADSIPYQLLEIVFLHEGKSAQELAEDLFISSSTFYRTVHDINEALDSRGFQIETNPCKIVGDEGKIRYFAYQYFFERYTRYEWPFECFDEKIIDEFLKIFIQFTKNPSSFASLTTLKNLFVINLIRYKNGHLIDTSSIPGGFPDVRENFKELEEIFCNLEESTGIKITEEFMKQMFYAYLQEDFFLTYDAFKEKANRNPEIAKGLIYLEEFVDDISQKHDIPLPNKEELVVALHDSTLLEYQESRSGYILYNQHGHFVRKIKKEFPVLYQDLYEGASGYRELVGALDTEKGKYFFIYTIFINWKNLTLNLRNRHDKIKTLVISERHISHAYMLKDFLNHEYPKMLETEIFSEFNLSTEVLENLPHELIITNFPFPELPTKKLVYIQNVPSYKDLTKIQTAVGDIMEEHNIY